MNRLILKNNKKSSGFTIIETLVAISILMIAVAGPLVIASKGLSAALYGKDQSVATFLAAEGMEMVRNIKDEQIKLNPGSDVGSGFYNLFSASVSGSMGDLCSGTTVSASCAIWLSPATSDARPQYNSCIAMSECRMFQLFSQAADIGYRNLANYTVQTSSSPSSSPGSTAYLTSNFTRYFYVTPTSNVGEYQVTVVVKWTQGTLTNMISMNSQMTSTIL